MKRKLITKLRFKDKNILTWISIIVGVASILILFSCGIRISPDGLVEFSGVPLWVYIAFSVMIIWMFVFLIYKIIAMERKIEETEELVKYLASHIENKTDKDIEDVFKFSKRTRNILLNHVLSEENDVEV